MENSALRQRLARKARTLVDGLGAQRVVDAMRRFPLSLRDVRSGDCEMLWKWANNTATRAASFHSEPIPWEVHLEWFRKQLAAPDTRFYIAVNALGESVGQIRFALSDSRATVSVSIAPEHRGTGYGSVLVRQASARVRRETSTRQLDAFVKPDNQVSVRVFLNAGYSANENVQVAGQPAIHFVCRLGDEQ